MSKNRFEIVDDKGVIYSGFTEEQTRDIFGAIIEGDEKWLPDDRWKGDLKLIEVHAVHK